MSCGVYSEVPMQGIVWADTGELDEMFRELAQQRESRIEEGYLQGDPVHVWLSILPK